jgi:hypothetical protein
MLVISLIKEHILSVSSFGGKVLQYTIRANPMFRTQLLPELHANCKNETGESR